MKKITNNTSLGKLTMLLNVLVLVLFIISMVFLMNFDKINKQVVDYRPTYDTAFEQLTTAEHPIKQNQAEVDYYQHKLDTLSAKTAANKEEVKVLSENISVTKKTLSEKQKQLADSKASISKNTTQFTPIKSKWDSLNQDNDSAKTKFYVIFVITVVAFIAKILTLAAYNYKNSKNLHNIAFWMKDGMPSWLSYVAWFIPIYNLGKPFSFIKEIWEETDYILEDKHIVMPLKDNQVDNSGLHLGIWWGLLLCSVWLMNFVLYKTFFTEGALFIKANHGSMVVVAIILMVLCMLEEFYLIMTYNKKNLILVDNENKFDDVAANDSVSSKADAKVETVPVDDTIHTDK